MKAILSIILIFVSVGASAQSAVWVKSEDFSSSIRTPEFVNFTKATPVKMTKPFSNSRNPELQKVFQIECDCDATDLYASMHKMKGFTGIEYAPKFETLEMPNDYNITYSNNWALDLIGAQTAWTFTTGNPLLNVAVSDQNFYQNHEELIGKINYYDATNTQTKTHGTAVATIVAGNTNNGIGNSSIGYNTSLSLYRMNYNEALTASYSGARVINLSWASGCYYSSYAQAAIDEIWNNGTFIVAAAGNGGTCGGADNLVYPAAYNHVFAVTSIGPNDNIERFVGNPGTRHQTNSSVDICAPGFDVPLTPAPGWYTTGNGTSFAAPYVTGTVALMLSVNESLTNEEIENILKITATNIDAINPSYIGRIGSGRLNSSDAVRIAYEMGIPEDDGNNGHGNDEDGFDDSNPGQGNGNNGNGNNGNGNNGNGKPDKPGNQGHEKSTDNNNTTRSNRTILNTMGQEIQNLEFAPTGFYFINENGITTKIYKQ